ncbi:DNA ligase 1 [Gossypium australe]|uniref:DNA ligase n=1 Tax=Gossypium australe TaxID=47621 RepID=A0A5B6UFN7_9ROSI|nr:DNA ligase 1 [Gossypium australe]
MLTFRPSHLLRYTCCITRPLTPLLPPSSSHFLPSNSLFFRPKPLSLSSLNPHSNMSTRPSAFDALMSNARRLAGKKSSSSSSPTKKRKSPDSSPTQNPNPPKTVGSTEVKHDPEVSSDGTGKPINDSPKPNLDEAKKPPDSKKVKVGSASERNVEMKGKIGLLKKKPADFDPNMVACWEKGERVPFLFLSLAFDLISNETGRIVITDIVCNMLRTVIATTPDDLVATVYLAANKVAPAHEGLELGIGDASIIKALAEACGRTESQVRSQYKDKGDLGLVAQASRSSQSMMRKPDPLTVIKVFDTFRLIAKESGKDSQEKKKNRIKSLLVAATDCEPQSLGFITQTKLRIGFSEQTLLAALGQAAVYNEQHSKPPPNVQSPLEEAVCQGLLDIEIKSGQDLCKLMVGEGLNEIDCALLFIFGGLTQAAKIVKQVFSILPVYDKIVPALLTGGIWDLPKSCGFTPGVPVGPMLAKPTKGVAEIINKFQDIDFICEYKYDGERAQIHYLENGSVEIYSRNSECNTGKFPDVVAAISRFKKSSVKSFVLDCELVAYDRVQKKILPFQILSTRARKNVVVSEIKVDVCIFAFDILYLNGQPLLHEQLKVRKECLYDSFEEEPGFFQFATALTSNDLEEIQTFLNSAVSSSCEGLIIKTLDRDATYEPSKRSLNWLKLKKDYMESIGDTLDLVPIAAFHGRGKRTGIHFSLFIISDDRSSRFYGAFLLACYDENNEEFQSICKIGTGFSEAELEERSASLRSKVIPEPKSYYRCSEMMKPDVWFETTEVWEVKAADLTISPVHRAAIGIVDPDKGISLRFPRLVRVREDKTPEQASSSEQVAEMYNAQKHNQTNNEDDGEDD